MGNFAEVTCRWFECIEETSQFNDDFIERYNEYKEEGYFLEADVQYLEELYELCNDLPFLPERMEIGKVEKVIANLYDKKNMLYTSGID